MISQETPVKPVELRDTLRDVERLVEIGMVRAARFTLTVSLEKSEEAEARGEAWGPSLVRELRAALQDFEREHPLPP